MATTQRRTVRWRAGVLGISSFRHFWMAGIVSYVGSWMHRVAAAWLMLELTGSALWVALMAGSGTFPSLFLAPVGGALADLRDRKQVLMWSQGLQAAAALATAVAWYLDVLGPGLLLTLGLVMGLGVAISNPTWLAFISDLVPTTMLADAVALNAAGFNVSRAIGPALGGILVATVGAGVPFTVNAVSFTVVILVLAVLGADTWRGGAGTSIRRAIAEGVRFVRTTRPLPALLALSASFAFSTAFLQAILPNLIADELRRDADVYGLLLGAMGTGALLGAFGRKRTDRAFRGRFLPISVAGFAAMGAVVGASRVLPLTTLAMTFAGVFWVFVLSTLLARIQLLSPSGVRGRVMSLFSVAFLGFVPLGALTAGALGDAVGLTPTFLLLSGLVGLVAVLAATIPPPTAMEKGMPDPDRLEPPRGGP